MKTRSTLDQWQVIEAIVRRGSFEQAAQSLHMSQSSVSYAVARLQEALGIPLLEADGRRARLTASGAELLEQVRPLLRGFVMVEAQAEMLAKGQMVELHLASDSAFPDELLFPALRNFQKKFPAVRLTLRQGIRLSAEAAFSRYGADLCISTPGAAEHPAEPLLEVEMLAVAHRNHALHRISERLTHRHLANHVMVRIADVESQAPLPTLIEGCPTWTVNTILAALSAVRHGACFGWLPADTIRADLASGEVKLLNLVTGVRRVTNLFLALRNDLPTSSPAHDLARVLRQAASEPRPF
jgi:DNA-binding transcriptional LysR family regulator